MDERDIGVKGRALLLGLMTLGGEASNPELAEHVGYPLNGELRRRLEDLGLTRSDRIGRSYHHELLDKGWLWCTAELSGSRPPRSGSVGGALYGVLDLVGRFLAAEDLALNEFVAVALKGTKRKAAAEEAAVEPSSLIRRAYWELAREPQDWVPLSALRALLGDLSRSVVDEELRSMVRSPGVHLVPQADQRNLTAADRAAAVRVGGEDNHLLAIEAR
ncbi:hypothetical protein [Actinocorallia sp. A-T 12471]|uniref:hypothetical protein n=1 Tax=Actinocorallia sp. A-T 12471 TaxID=3089813 RepID=UPI0029CFBBAD|nr:hypothetical protein [Actinocorallia sp. A-T 12471]MDX6741151.1 hypothetical protein [Actinocorallia sp. A-T 12471]